VFVAAVQRRVLSAGVAAPTGAVARGGAAAAAAVLLVSAWIGGPAGLVAAAIVVGGGGAVALRLLEQRARRLSEGALAEAVESVASGLRTGLSLRQGLEAAARDAPPALAAQLHLVVAQVDAGIPMAEALDGWGARSAPTVRLAVAALTVGARTGGAHARALSGVAHTIRDRVALRAEVRAMAAQARLSALVITVAPVGFIAFTAATDERIAAFLFRTPPGWAVLTAGLALDAVAGVWMAHLSRIEP
jgi:tight adherence protein B